MKRTSFVFYRLMECVTVLLTTEMTNVVKAKIVRGLRKTFKVQLMIFKWQARKRQTPMHGKDDLKNSLEQKLLRSNKELSALFTLQPLSRRSWKSVQGWIMPALSSFLAADHITCKKNSDDFNFGRKVFKNETVKVSEIFTQQYKLSSFKTLSFLYEADSSQLRHFHRRFFSLARVLQA